MASQGEGYYDPPLPKQQAGSSDNRTQALQDQIDQATRTMRHNVDLASQRGENLDTLQGKTDNLATQAGDFRRGANRVRKQMWWKDMKMRVCIIVGIIVLLLVIIIPSVLATKGK